MIEVHWTAGSIDEARKVSRFLVGKKLVASAQIIPWIESILLMGEQVQTTQESKVVFKTSHELLDEIKQVIIQNCKYQVPEITCFKVDNVNQEYLEWLQNNVKINTTQDS